jgi:hypothetical protein
MSAKLAVSVPVAARLLGISKTRAWESVWGGQWPSLQVGRRRLVPVGWLAQQLAVPVETLARLLADDPAGGEQR